MIHYTRSNWEKRKNRINYDNLFIIMYDRDGIAEEDIRKLETVKCKNKIVLSDKKHDDIDYVIEMNKNDVQFGEQCLDKDWLGRRTFEKQFNLVQWLNV